MKRIHIIRNGKSPKNTQFQNLVMHLLEHGHSVSLHSTSGPGDATREASLRCREQDVDLIISFGGDGTLHEVINGIMPSEKHIPISIYGGGTQNDLARSIGIPDDEEEYAKMITRFEEHAIDVGKANDSYFINVLACGSISSVAHKANQNLKGALGPIAYYMEGLRQVSPGKISKQRIKIESPDFSYEGEYFLFMIANSTSVGGFRKINPGATIDDGVYNVTLIKRTPASAVIEILMGVTDGSHVDCDEVEYFETSKLKVTTMDEFDVDGEAFEGDSIDVEVLEKALTIIY